MNVDIDPEVLAKFDALPDSRNTIHPDWTPELDALLLRYWPVKRKLDVARAIGIPEIKCRARWEHLRDHKDGD